MYHYLNYDKEIKIGDLEKSFYYHLLKTRVDPVTYEKLVNFLINQVKNINPSEKSQLYFAMLATLVGHNSKCVDDSDWAWKVVWEASGEHQKTANYMLGILVQWVFAKDDRYWRAYKQETGKVNDLGEDIERTSYWVRSDEAFQPFYAKKTKTVTPDLVSMVNAFNARYKVGARRV